jgi:hypothetical protein
MSYENENKYSLIDRENILRQLTRKYRKISDKDYPEPNYKEDDELSLDKYDYLKNMIRGTNLQYDNIRPIFITLEIPKK